MSGRELPFHVEKSSFTWSECSLQTRDIGFSVPSDSVCDIAAPMP